MREEAKAGWRWRWGGEGQRGGGAEQKDVMTTTHNVVRRHTDGNMTAHCDTFIQQTAEKSRKYPSAPLEGMWGLKSYIICAFCFLMRASSLLQSFIAASFVLS